MAQDALFFHDGTLQEGQVVQLSADVAKHVVQVLRLQIGGTLQLTDGKGHQAFAMISDISKRDCTVNIQQVIFHERVEPSLHLAVAFTKNANRNEWLLEKATELGVASITPLLVKRTVRDKVKYERWHNILVAAILQSQQYYLPKLSDTTDIDDYWNQLPQVEQKLIAHCIDTQERTVIKNAMQAGKSTLLLIGPEGDFTEEEVAAATQNGFKAISISGNRLRTETAAINACAYFNCINHE